MKESYSESLANYIGSESCLDDPRGCRKGLTGESTNIINHHAYNTVGCLTNLNGTAFDWDERYRLLSVDDASSFVQYTYDVLNQRASRTSLAGGITNVEFYVYNGNQIIADLDATGNRLRTYIWGTGIDNLLSMTIYTNGGAQASATYYAIKDHQNTVIALTDSTGTVVESYEYDAYGRILDVKDASGNSIANQQSAIGNRYAFQGREIDWTTGLIYFRARWYNPETGRWLSKDPIGISGGLNLYAFCENNPVNFVDPDGLTVRGTFNRSAGTITVIDNDTNRGAGGRAFSGGGPDHGPEQNNPSYENVQNRGPLPAGTYTIKPDRKGRDGWYELDPNDSRSGNDIHDPSGRSMFRLHEGGWSAGCVTVQWGDPNWDLIQSLLDNTKRDKEGNYGTLCVE